MVNRRRAEPGPGVDAQGQAVVDPTANVLQLTEAGNKRQDDLRDNESRHIRELMQRDRGHAKDLRVIETDRLNAIRAVDVGAVQRAAEVQQQAAITLQGQVAASAEAMRTQVAATNVTFTESLAAAIKPLTDALAAVQQQQFMQAGSKQQVVESRDTRGETRLNLGAVVAVVSVLLVALCGFGTMVIGAVALILR